jgi:hypothetical protein
VVLPTSILIDLVARRPSPLQAEFLGHCDPYFVSSMISSMTSGSIWMSPKVLSEIFFFTTVFHLVSLLYRSAS